MEVNGAPKQPGYKLSSKYRPLCSAEQRRSYRFGTTWGSVNDDRIFIFGWTIPLMNRSKWPYKTRFISRVPTLLESTWISDIWIQGLESTWIKFEIHFIYGAISKIVHMCCQRQKETALMIGRWCSAEKNLVCVDAQPRALRGTVFLRPFPLSFWPTTCVSRSHKHYQYVGYWNNIWMSACCSLSLSRSRALCVKWAHLTVINIT